MMLELDDRMRELIAIGASVTANCQPCLQYHIRKAQEHGAADREVATAIAIGRLVRQGAASKMDDFAERLGQTASVAAEPTPDSCGCSQ